MLFRGTAPALVTPFTADDTFDADAFRRLIDHQLEGGVEAVLVLGTTGENATVSDRERERIVEAAIERVDGRLPVIVGTGNNATGESIARARQAASAGADGHLVVGPYYNKPMQAGFRAHVEAIAEAVDLPMILYNVPSRTRFNIEAETALRLAEDVPAVVGIKEASGDLAQIADVLAGRPEGFAVYAGDDEMAFPLAALGADGVISVVANALPGRFSDLVRDALAGDLEGARQAHFELLPALRACFAETNPIPIKAVLHQMGLVGPHLRLPMLPLSDAARPAVMRAFEAFLSVPA